MSVDAPRISVTQPNGPTLAWNHEGAVLRVGRDRHADVVVRDGGASREHAELRRVEHGWIVVDLGSLNGTTLNGRRITSAMRLRPGDRIEVCGVRIVFDPGPAPRAERTTARPAPGDGRGAPLPATQAALVGDSPAMRALRQQLERFARSAVTVLLTGESGTGKDLAAGELHARSNRAHGPFVVVDCPAIAQGLVEAELFGTEPGVATGVASRPGRLELAEGGTLFLDEVGDLSPAAQARLLRFLQEKEVARVGARSPRRVDVRVVAATNRDLGAAVTAGAFREDLFHRLDTVRLEMPPLRERLEDLPVLVAHLLARQGVEPDAVAPEALAVLATHDWPGNVRELEHALVRALLLSPDGRVGAADLDLRPDEDAAPSRASNLLSRIVAGESTFWAAVREPFLRRELDRETVRALVREARRRSDGTRRGVAELLGESARYRKLVDFLRNHDLWPDT